MNIIICGAGDVGRHTAEVLAPAGHGVTVIDQKRAKLDILDEVLDVRSLQGNGTQAEVLLEAGAAGADVFIAATNIDEVNLLSASVAKAVGAKKCIARVHHSTYFDKRGLDYETHLGIDQLICPEATTANAIAAALRSPGAIAIESFARGRIEMQTLPVSRDARAVGKQLQELALPNARLAAIEHEGQAAIPIATTRVAAGDVVTLIGDSESFEKVRQQFDTSAGKRLRVIIIGGSTQGVWLCRALKGRNYSVRLFEQNKERAVELSEKLGWVTILNADVIQTEALQDERIDLADAFVAASEEDENNILAAARAKSMGAKMAIAVLQRGTYLHLIKHVGIDRAFSPREQAVTEIMRRLDEGPVRELATIAEDVAELYEVRVSAAATAVIDQPLKQAASKLPPRCLIVAVQRGDRVFVPTGDDEVRARDTLVVVGPTGQKRALRKAFAGR